jgi:hypothetical protein
MKKHLLTVLFMVLMFAGLFAGKAYAGGLSVYSVNLSTYSVSDADTLEVQLSGDKKIHRVLISNSDKSVMQTVSFYENATSTDSVSFSWEIDLAQNANLNHIVDLVFEGMNTYWKAKNLAIRKSVPDSDVKVTIWYR